MESRNERRGNLLELLVIRATASRMNETAGDTGDEKLVINDKLHNGIELLLALLEHLVEHVRLRNSARETIEHETVKASTSVVRRAETRYASLRACPPHEA